MYVQSAPKHTKNERTGMLNMWNIYLFFKHYKSDCTGKFTLTHTFLFSPILYLSPIVLRPL